MGVDKDNVLLGDSVTLTITVRNAEGVEPPSIPPLPDLDVQFRGTRQESYSSFTMIVQGRTVEQRRSGGGYHFDYRLTPKRAGLLQVPSWSLEVGGKSFQTQPFTIEVYDQAERSEDIFVEVSVDKDDVYLGERIRASVKWYFNKEIGAYRMNVPWLEGLKNLLVTDPQPLPGRRYHRFTVNEGDQVIATKQREFYKGQPYIVIAFEKLLTPISVGTYTLDPVFLRADVVRGYQRRRARSFFDEFFDSSFDSFFGFGSSAVTEPFSTRSEPVQITVREVPQAQRPESFSGGVGLFDFRVEVKPQRLAVGEPITVTMQVIGAGNIEQVNLPPFPAVQHMKRYEPKTRVNTTEKDGEIVGEKIFELVLVPKREGRYEIPPISFSYFNPRERAYRTLTRGPFPVSVAPGVEEEPVRVIALEEDEPARARKKEIAFIERDIQYIKTELGPQLHATAFYKNPLAWLSVYLMPLLVLGGLFTWQSHRERLRTDVGFARHRLASKHVRRYLDHASKALHAKDSRTFYDALSKGLSQYLADKLNRPVGAVQIQGVCQQLEAKGAAEDLVAALRALDERCQMSLFASAAIEPAKLQEDFNRARGVIDRLEKVL